MAIKKLKILPKIFVSSVFEYISTKFVHDSACMLRIADRISLIILCETASDKSFKT